MRAQTQILSGVPRLDVLPLDELQRRVAGKQPLEELLRELQEHGAFRNNFAHVHRVPPREARTVSWPAALHPDAIAACVAQGIERPYSHQAAAAEHAIAGRNVVAVTPTASGKTLCYNLPVLNALATDPEARAIYLFPTKALSHDQYRGLYDLTKAMKRDIRVFTYDGDTPPATRRSLRSAGHLIVTNPDMLHCGILPHHTQWEKLFENLRFVIVDELHQYRGVFGSHLANVLRRLDRLCKFYGADPVYLASSATIANPKELAESLTGKKFEIVAESGAPTGEKFFLFYNPPVINKELNVRRSARLEVQRLAMRCIARGHQTIVFGRSRIDVEVMTTYLKRAATRAHLNPATICGYRSGYLPTERRAIEDGVKRGEILGIVSTNALELGIDIGGLDVSILAGWPGTVASAWQQAGRAGRKGTASLAIYIAGSSPLDQFLMNHPEYFFDGSPEQGIVNPENTDILLAHLKCATFELPFEDGEGYGPASPAPILQALDDAKVVRHSGGRWFYASDAYPAENVSLRGGAGENFIVLNTADNNRVIAEVDFDSAPFLIHDDAIYIHNGRTFYVEKLEWERRSAYVRPKVVDYYTDAESSFNVQVLEVDREGELRDGAMATKRFGAVSVTTVVAKFKKVKFETQESIGYGPVNVPQLEVQTEGTWFTFGDEAISALKASRMEPSAALAGVANLLRQAIPLYVLCDARDFGVAAMVRAPFDQKPTIYVWDRYPGGTGLARKLFSIDADAMRSALSMVSECRCTDGCPSCVGAQLEAGGKSKRAAALLLRGMLGER